MKDTIYPKKRRLLKMSNEVIFHDLTGWEPTRDTLKWYSRSVGVIPRAHAESHPKWWHISLKVVSDGMVTDRMPLPTGGLFWLKMDLVKHEVQITTEKGLVKAISMKKGLTSTEFGDQVTTAVRDLGLSGEYAREKFENDDRRLYDRETARTYLNTLVHSDRILKQHRSSLDGELGPVQLWPHGFDLAFEWFGTRVVEYEEGGEVSRYPSQLNFGFSPGEPSHKTPYYYSNPWPFEKDQLVEKDLPYSARWFTEGWEGSILPYEYLVDDPQAEEKLSAYFQKVYKIAAPTLTA
jgi:hypothetical protein